MKVLIADSDVELAERLRRAFAESGFQVELAGDGKEVLQKASQQEFDAYVVDTLISGAKGFAILDKLRIDGRDTPVLFLSADNSVELRIESFEQGGDDFIAKPLAAPEVVLRTKAILRRLFGRANCSTLQFQDLEVDLSSRSVRRGTVNIELNPKEFALLEFLLRNLRKVITKTQILEQIWKYDFDPQTNVVDVLVCRLRMKIDKRFRVKLIKTYRGAGYAIGMD